MDTTEKKARRKYQMRMESRADRLEQDGAPKRQVDACRSIAAGVMSANCNCGGGHSHDGSGYCGE